ncbi:MAG: hypothetical protein DRQ88_08340 [Epsilonproteobacteria bacterium]|nr:MAG: hypothetical protein DRQ89_06690 [Campylobacterota bacterium]RLA65937.1 MAG: hypothetical protein DRQ88_08340 [Campylobacterota bacterium]
MVDSTRETLEGEKSFSSSLFKILIWRIDDVAKFLQVSKGHLYNLVSRGELPHRKKGGLLFFLPTEIQTWVEEGEV